MNACEFKQHIQSLGYGEPQPREYDANRIGELHTHDFSAILLVLSGEFILALEDDSIKCTPGELHEVNAGVLHDERTGSAGAVILLATK